ncbi:MAG: hypothetical protein H6539_01895 [Bacteroidales bacterium]|nr:hypothetical protein [Bacteroidales bacterium]
MTQDFLNLDAATNFTQNSLHYQTLGSRQSNTGRFSESWVNPELFYEFRTATLSFILNLYGENHPYYIDFNHHVGRPVPIQIEQGRGILNSIKFEIDHGLLETLKGLVSAEIFSDFLDMAEHLLKENFIVAAAVMIGCVLEEHLRQLCDKNDILTTYPKSGKPKKADLLNSELSNADVYNRLDLKNVTAWLDLRNKAAHGNTKEFNQAQVELMMQAVTEFISRNN